MKKTLITIASVSLLAGCGPEKKDTVNTVPLPKPPIASPARVDKPIDQDLRRNAIAELNRAMKDSDPVRRANAIEGAQNSLGPVVADQMLAALDDKDSVVRFAAAMALGTLKIPEARTKLLTLLEDPSRQVQIAVRYALHRLNDTRHSHDLEAYAIDRDPTLRATTVMVLGLLKEKSAMNILNDMQRDLDPAVQLQVTEARYRLGDETAVEDLVIATVSKYADDQIVALLALGSQGDVRNSRIVAGKLTSDYVEVSLAAARALGMMQSDLGMGVALNAATASEPRQRALAALALGQIGRTDAQSALEKMLKDSDANVRLAAATAILQLKPTPSAQGMQDQVHHELMKLANNQQRR